jgi:hypothetical protein
VILHGKQQQALWSTNKGQKFDLVFINEIHYDNAGTDIEKAFAAGYAELILTGWSLFPTTETEECYTQ